MTEHRKQILDMLSEGKISVEGAESLLGVLKQPAGATLERGANLHLNTYAWWWTKTGSRRTSGERPRPRGLDPVRRQTCGTDPRRCHKPHEREAAREGYRHRRGQPDIRGLRSVGRCSRRYGGRRAGRQWARACLRRITLSSIPSGHQRR